MQTSKKRRGALELSIGTIVIIVLAMTMLILGLVLVRTIFTGATYNVEQMNNKVKDEINKLFVEDKKIVVYLSNQKTEIKQGESWGVAWALKNLQTGTPEAAMLSYDIVISDDNIRQNCGISEQTAQSWIVLGGSESNIPVQPGETIYSVVRLNIPESAPLCLTRYRINSKLNGQDYASEYFDIDIRAK
ncbi:MAG: hypothetical protein ABIE22_05000 [archaeon]